MITGLTIHSLNNQGFALISSSSIRLNSSDFNQLEWQIDGLNENVDLQFVWTTRRAPKYLNYVDLFHTDGKEGIFDLNNIENWNGFIGAIGLRIKGILAADLTIRQIKLKTAPPTITKLLSLAWDDWTYFEGWNEHSINFIVGGPRFGPLLRPLPTIIAWIGLSIFIYAVLSFAKKRFWSIRFCAIFFLIGWFVLDLRWQIDLWRQHLITYTIFSGKNWESRRLSDRDGELFAFIIEAKKKLPSEPARIYIVSADPDNSTKFIRLRAHYHLLPHNVYSKLSSLPTADKIRDGDYLLILNPIKGLEYNSNDKKLTSLKNNISYSAKLLYSAKTGYVFRLYN